MFWSLKLALRAFFQITVRAANGAGMHYDTDPGANVFHNATLRNMLYTTWKHVAEHYKSWD